MSDDAIQDLLNAFERFPAIGPRQAQRFVQFLLRSSPLFRRELVESIQNLSGSVRQCSECMRYHSGKGKICDICSSSAREHMYLAVVANDADLSALEKSGTYHGRYFVVGGTLDLASDNTDRLRFKQLLSSLPSRQEKGLEEIILAFPANPEGDATAARLKEEIDRHPMSVKVTKLGRGLSTGSELEYADTDTLKSALESRR